ncbi:polyphosphate kinase [Dyadobacter jejuensis]|uniref:Polyphosphate kinase n=1 Tax=Dyadobacter jejuensis TaxID=1082580 RepID=A0A316AHJ7_9BACT|nr:polyphosphate kinase 1 [Dyadobacter jejuensis]PWJ56739.1 polyphosphate kinase [Dyadobacter jejuensis]
MIDASYPYFDVNLSWLSNNYRLLLEAQDDSVPVRERLQFLGHYAYQTNEFFRVRIPTIMAMGEVTSDIRSKLNIYPQSLIEHVRETIENQQIEFYNILSNKVLPELYEQGVHLYFQESFAAEHQSYSRYFFIEKLFRYLQPILLESKRSAKFAVFEPKKLYLVIRLQRLLQPDEDLYATVNIPTDSFGRFIELPELDGKRHYAFVDDIIKENLNILFPGYEVLDSYAFRMESEVEFNIEDEYPLPMAQRILKQLEKRNFALSLPYFTETGVPINMRNYMVTRLSLAPDEFNDSGPYIFLQDLMTFPFVSKKLTYPDIRPIQSDLYRDQVSVFDYIQQGDRLLHLPYHSYEPIIRFFNEAAVDPQVKEIQVSLYKISPNSFILNSLISAARNGKRVLTYVELNTKLDIQENIHWSRKMRDAGVKIILNAPGLKVHAKIALVKRRGQKGWERYGFLGTGGFYKLTSREIVDHALLTCNREITNELELLFGYLATQEEPKKYKYLPFNTLSVTQFNLQKRLIELIDREIVNSNAGLRAFVTIKINQIQDHILIDKLYEAGQAGVSVHVIVSESSCLIAGLPSISDNITVYRHIDRFVENTRIFHFCNRGEEEIFLSSCDWTFRNLHRRIDICFPILEDNLKSQLKLVLRNYQNDTQKAVKLDLYQNNLSLKEDGRPKLRAQDANYRLVEKWKKVALNRIKDEFDTEDRKDVAD